MLDLVVDLCELTFDLIKNIPKMLTKLFLWVLSVLDLCGMVFTYLSILLVTIIIVGTYVRGNLLTPLVGCVLAYTLIYINRSIKGGTK